MSLPGSLAAQMAIAFGEARTEAAINDAASAAVHNYNRALEWQEYARQMEAKANQEAERASQEAQRVTALEKENRALRIEIDQQQKQSGAELLSEAKFQAELLRRLRQTEKALKHSSAKSEALQQIYKMLESAVRALGVTEDQISLLDVQKQREVVNQVYDEFMRSGRFATTPEQDDELRKLGAPIPPRPNNAGNTRP